MRITGKTKLSDSVTSYKVEFGTEELNDKEAPEDRYQRHLNELRYNGEETEDNNSQDVQVYWATAIKEPPV